MGLKQETFRKRIRETISGLSDEELINMQRGSTENYTSFAKEVAKQELTDRKQKNAAQNDGLRDNKETGCYVEIWSDKDFAGEHLLIKGPVERSTLGFDELDWGDSISSLRVGPGAFVLVYADEDFKGTMMSFGPSQEVADLEELCLDDDIDSIRLVNSLKIFDELRADPGNARAASGHQKPAKRARQPKPRGGDR